MIQKRKRSLFPKTIGKCVEPLVKPLFKSRGLAGTGVLTDWPRIVGAEMSRHCWPEKISFPQGKKTNGTLTVAVENGFATDIQHLQPLILERLNTFYGYQAVTKLAISHSSLRPAQKKAVVPPTRRTRISKDAINDVKDPELKNALQSLANSLSDK